MATGGHAWHAGHILGFKVLYSGFNPFMRYDYDRSGGMVHFLGGL